MSSNIKRMLTVKQLLAENGGPLPISRSGVYSLVMKGIIPSCRLGNKILVDMEDVLELLKTSEYKKEA